MGEPSVADSQGDASTGWLLSPLLTWLLRDAWKIRNARQIADEICRRLLAEGVPLWRFNLFFRTLHPELFGDRFQWTREAGRTRYDATPRAVTQSPVFTRSPLLDAGKSGLPLRRRLTGPEALLDYPLMEELRAAGGTDYLALPMPFSDGSTTFLTVASDAPDGFSAANVALLTDLAVVLGRIAEAVMLRTSAARLLDIYVGHDAGERILQGQIHRGTGETLRAAIWLCDLRGFSTLSDTLPRDDMIRLLNGFFDRMAAPVQAAGGHILKFIGDAMLAIFPVGRGGDAAAARAALGAALKAQAAMAVAGDGLRCGIALHVGDVMYGNIGAASRLDFTVIGPAVNLAARLQGLCSAQGEAVLLSSDCAALVDTPLEPLGRFAVKGLAEPLDVFRPPPAASG